MAHLETQHFFKIFFYLGVSALFLIRSRGPWAEKKLKTPGLRDMFTIVPDLLFSHTHLCLLSSSSAYFCQRPFNRLKQPHSMCKKHMRSAINGKQTLWLNVRLIHQWLNMIMTSYFSYQSPDANNLHKKIFFKLPVTQVFSQRMWISRCKKANILFFLSSSLFPTIHTANKRTSQSRWL